MWGGKLNIKQSGMDSCINKRRKAHKISLIHHSSLLGTYHLINIYASALFMLAAVLSHAVQECHPRVVYLMLFIALYPLYFVMRFSASRPKVCFMIWASCTNNQYRVDNFCMNFFSERKILLMTRVASEVHGNKCAKKTSIPVRQ